MPEISSNSSYLVHVPQRSSIIQNQSIYPPISPMLLQDLQSSSIKQCKFSLQNSSYPTISSMLLQISQSSSTKQVFISKTRYSIFKHQTMPVFLSQNSLYPPNSPILLQAFQSSSIKQCHFFFQNTHFILQSRPCSSKHQIMPICYSKTHSILQSRPCSSKLLSHQASNNANFLFQNIFYHPISSMLLQASQSSSIKNANFLF